jgi:hypothetical protein
MTTTTKRLLVVLESPLGSDGQELLGWIVRRLSIKREQWSQAFCYPKNRKHLSTRKWLREKELEPYVEKLVETIRRNEPCVIVGMGKLASEVLLGITMIKKVTGTKWRSKLRFARMEGHEALWITHSPNAALFDPNLAVEISQVVWQAALEAELPAELDHSIKLLSWEKYI